MATRTGRFDADTLRRSMEQNDPQLFTSLFHDDAECVVIDKAHPPSNPLVQRGKDQIGKYNEGIVGGNKTHRFDKLIVSDETAAYADACEYEDGTRVYCTAFLDLRDGKITRQVCVQAWDE